MGLFSFFADAAADLASNLVDRVGKAVETFGRFTHIGVIEDVGIDIQVNNPFDRIGQTDISSANVDEMLDINAECEKARRSAEIQSGDIVDKCIVRLEDKIKELEKQFPAEIISNYNYFLEDAFIDEIKTTISSYIAKTVSIDNDEFNQILNMPDEERKGKSEEFMKQTLVDAERELKTKCNNKYIAICKKMIDDVDEYCERQRNYAQEMSDNLERLKESENEFETKMELIKEKIIDASTIESIRSLTYSN